MATLMDDQKKFFSTQAATITSRANIYQLMHDKSAIIALTGTLDEAFETGDRDTELLAFEVRSDVDDIRIEVFEGVTYTGGTTPNTNSVNTDRNSTATAVLVAVVDPTVTDLGTKISNRRLIIAAGQGSSNTGLQSTAAASIMMKRSTKYLIRFTNLDSTAAIMSTVTLYSESIAD